MIARDVDDDFLDAVKIRVIERVQKTNAIHFDRPGQRVAFRGRRRVRGFRKHVRAHRFEPLSERGVQRAFELLRHFAADRVQLRYRDEVRAGIVERKFSQRQFCFTQFIERATRRRIHLRRIFRRLKRTGQHAHDFNRRLVQASRRNARVHRQLRRGQLQPDVRDAPRAMQSRFGPLVPVTAFHVLR